MFKYHCLSTVKVQETRTQEMSHLTRKPVFGVCAQLRLEPACSADKTSWGPEILAIANRGIIVSRQQTTKALIRLRRLICGSFVHI